jgi:hypothetical protein
VLTREAGELPAKPQERSVLKKARQYFDMTPLHAACINPNTAVLTQLLSVGGSVSEVQQRQ